MKSRRRIETLVREDIRAQVIEAVYRVHRREPLDATKSRTVSRISSPGSTRRSMVSASSPRFSISALNDRYPPFPPDIFDDPDAMARNTIDLDIGDCGRLLLDDGVDLDDRAAVERRIGHLWIYHRSNPAFQARFIDEAIGAGKGNKAAGGSSWHRATSRLL